MVHDVMPDFCPEGCYWQCEHRAPLTVEDRLHRAYAPSEALREALKVVRGGGVGYQYGGGVWRGSTAEIGETRPIWRTP